MYINKFIRINLLKFCVYSYLDIGNFYQKQLLLDCFFVRYSSVVDRMTSSVRYKAEVDQYILKFWQFSYIFVRSNWNWKNINEVKARWVGPIKERQKLAGVCENDSNVVSSWSLLNSAFKWIQSGFNEGRWTWLRLNNKPSISSCIQWYGR